MIEVAIRYDNLWQMPMPYVMAIHQAPTDDGTTYSIHHLEYHPPLRQPDTMKYLAGPEIGRGSMTNESDPDAKAAELKAVSKILYRATNRRTLTSGDAVGRLGQAPQGPGCPGG